jgi:hypothetical protein
MLFDVKAVRSHRLAVSTLGVLALATLVHCGGSASSPTVNPTPVPTATPAPTRPRSPGLCNPTPPPLHGCTSRSTTTRVRKILDSRPQVVNTVTSPSYCELAGFGNWKFCFNREEGDPQMAACDAMSAGRALDTGRWGPTWYFNGEPCAAVGETTPGCRNHVDNQFLVIAKGPGEFKACANPSVPITGDRCGIYIIK